MGRFLDKLSKGELAIGTTDTLGSDRLVEVIGFAGLDMIKIDQMFCPADWETVARMVRAGRNYGIDILVRIQAFPWVGHTDRRLAADAARALGCGAMGVVFSVATADEVRQLVVVQNDWHRDIHIHPFSEEEFADYNARVGSECVVMPLVESSAAISEIDEIMAVEGLRAVSLGMSDLSRMLGHPFDYEHPEVERFVDRVVSLGKKHGVIVGGNVGYKYSRSPEEMIRRVARMREMGFQFIWLQNDGYVIQWTYRMLLGQMRAAVNVGK